MKRKTHIMPNEVYHLYNRGNKKNKIFFDERDYIRMVFLLLCHQSPVVFYNLGRQVDYYVKHRVFNIQEDIIHKISTTRYVTLINFTLMPNHWHATVYEHEENGIARYMQRTLNAYAKYINTKNEHVGHVFQGPYQATHIKDDNHLTYLSSYVHRNPREITRWYKHEHKYPWSSFQDYINKNRWPELLVPDLVLDNFSSGTEYKLFVEQSGGKLLNFEN